MPASTTGSPAGAPQSGSPRSGSPRTLILLRHAKSAWPPEVPDHSRPLAPRGRRDAAAVGRWLRQHAPPIDLVVCSPAVRARQTWQLLSAQLDEEPPVHYDERLYGTAAEVFRTVTRELPAQSSTVLLVAHNPSLEDFVELLTGDRVVLKTSAVAVLSTSQPWASAEPGRWDRAALATPRGD